MRTQSVTTFHERGRQRKLEAEDGAEGDAEVVVGAVVLASTREDSRGSWSPDGTQIAFNSDRSGDMNIYVHSLLDGSNRQITKGPGGDFQPQWSPDSKTTRVLLFTGGKRRYLAR